MAFVSGYRHDIFVSYAHVDDEPHHGAEEGWVTALIKGLKIELAKRLGRAEDFSLWMDYELTGNVPVTPEIMDNLRNSATLIVFLSQGYLASPWCQKERTNFLETVQERVRSGFRVFVIEIDQAKKPKEFGNLKGYRCWDETPVRKYPRPLGFPLPQQIDKEYYDMLINLSYDLANELRKLQLLETRQKIDNEERFRKTDVRATIFLAEVTEDLHFVREAVKGYLLQANIKVLPEISYPSEPQMFQNAVCKDLEQCELFVQLLNENPGTTEGFVYRQYDLALKVGKPILQWRSPDLRLEDITDSKHKDFLQHTTVLAVGIEEFKTKITKKLEAQKIFHKTPAPFVFVRSDPVDLDLSESICRELHQKFNVDYRNSPAVPKANSKLVERWILRSHGLMIVYGYIDVAWVEEQFLDLETIAQKQKPPEPIFAVYDGPPEDKPKVMLGIQRLHILNCRDCMREEELRKFVNALPTGGVS